ncbi:MAG: lysophospholipid acyltransferase family protein [Acidobacteriota bacterium]
MKRVIRAILRVFFRRITVLGMERLPPSGPVVLVSNHVNSLLDPLLVSFACPRPVRFLAKAPLFQSPFVGPFLRLLKAVPVQRRMDAGADMSKNAAMFEACEENLAKGEVLALFPEGRSHNEPHLVPFKTGAARIVGRALSGGHAPFLIPVGLVYSARSLFRSDAAVIVGLPTSYSDLPWNEPEAREAVEALTGRIRAELAAVTVNAERWEDVRLIEGLRPLAMESLGIDPGGIAEAELQRRLVEGYYEVRRSHPEFLSRLLPRARLYLRTLGVLKLTDSDVVRRTRFPNALGYTVRHLLFLAAGYPFALYGWLWHAVPYTLTGPIARAISKEEDVVATHKLYVGLGLLAVFYSVETAVLWLWLGPISLAAAAAGFLCGLWALRYYSRRKRFFHLIRAVLLLRGRKEAGERLRKLRSGVLEALEPIAALYGPPKAPAP